jgi:tetratricopeptide (TPR) repeat protein
VTGHFASRWLALLRSDLRRHDGPAALTSAPRWIHRLAPLLVALITLAVFLPTLQNQFVSWDDDVTFLDNPHYRGLGWTQLRWMWTTGLMGHYIPLTWMTLGLDYVLGGMNPFGYHLTSLLLHVANAAVFYVLVLRILSFAMSGRSERDPALIVSAGLAALVFAIHPLRVESVTWITERRDVLSGLFSLLTILVYLRACQRPERSRGWYWLSIVLFACALLSKSMSISLPVVLLILDVYPLRRLGGSIGWWSAPARRVYVEKTPFAFLAAAIAAITLWAQLQTPHVATLGQLGIVERLAISAYSLSFYLWKMILPLNLSPLYPFPGTLDPWAVPFILSYGLVLAITAIALALRRRWPCIQAVWLTYVVILLPVLGIVQNGPQITADRYTYLAGLGWALLAGAGVLACWRTWRRPLAGIALCVVGTWGVLTWNQVHIWHDSERLWTHVLAVEPDAVIAENNLGVELDRQGRLGEAIEHFQRAVRVSPEYALPHHNWGQALNRQGDHAGAIEHFQEALRLRPDLAEAHNDWGVALVARGDVEEAIKDFLQVLHISAEVVGADKAVDRRGTLAEAIEHFDHALRLKPDLAIAHANWGLALTKQGRPAAAIEHFRRALSIQPDLLIAQAGLALALQGGMAEAKDYHLAQKVLAANLRATRLPALRAENR